MQKLIYVRTEDEPLIEQVQAIEGQSLSAVVIKGLREYVQRHQGLEGYEPVAVRIGKNLTTDGGGVFRKVAFDGRLLSESKIGSRERIEYARFYEHEVYATSDSDFVLVEKNWEQEPLGSALNWYYGCRMFREQTLDELEREYAKTEKEFSISDLISVAHEALSEFNPSLQTGQREE